MKTSIDLKVVYTWSRMHSNRNNFLTITQVAHVLIPGQSKNGNSVTVKNNNLSELKDGYKTEEIASNTEDSISFGYLQECMDTTNPAIKDYIYFKVVFANGTEIICKSYEEFIEIIKQ